MTKDNLETCLKCGGDACYTTELNSTAKNYFCFGCGFTTNDLMIIGEFDFDQYEETLPELYKDIKVNDGTERVWYPITINLEDKGTVFAKGTSLIDWQWAGIKVKEVSKEEQEKFKIPGSDKSYKYKTDMTTLKEYSQHDFMEALEYINFFNN
jgi:hypothetical protein|tara:strand:- start:1224 stop:1682 length:459 start_codon:yes stop_codon:yes gene_type:complete